MIYRALEFFFFAEQNNSLLMIYGHTFVCISWAHWKSHSIDYEHQRRESLIHFPICSNEGVSLSSPNSPDRTYIRNSLFHSLCEYSMSSTSILYNSPFIQYYFHSHLVQIILATLTPTSCEKYHELLALYDFPSTFLHDDQLYQKNIKYRHISTKKRTTTRLETEV